MACMINLSLLTDSIDGIIVGSLKESKGSHSFICIPRSNVFISSISYNSRMCIIVFLGNNGVIKLVTSQSPQETLETSVFEYEKGEDDFFWSKAIVICGLDLDQNSTNWVKLKVKKFVEFQGYLCISENKSGTLTNLSVASFPNEIKAIFPFLGITKYNPITIPDSVSNMPLLEPNPSHIKSSDFHKNVSITKQKTNKKKRFLFSDYDIPIGAKLTFLQDTHIEVTVLNDRQILYQGKSYSMSGFAQEQTFQTACQGTAYFAYQGERLTDLRNRIDKERAEV